MIRRCFLLFLLLIILLLVLGLLEAPKPVGMVSRDYIFEVVGLLRVLTGEVALTQLCIGLRFTR